MTRHTFARVSGHGLTIVPLAPFQMRRREDGSCAVHITHESDQGPRVAIITPTGKGYSSEIEDSLTTLADVADIGTGSAGEWRVETTAYSCTWPAGYAVVSNNFPDDPAPFDFLGPRGELVFIQTPRRIPPVGQLIAPEQRVLAVRDESGLGFIELEYVHEGEIWRQRHDVIELAGTRVRAGVTAQARAADFQAALMAGQLVVTSLRSAAP